jgi:hypothetical protein
MNRNPDRIHAVVDLLIGALPSGIDQRIETLRTIADLVPQGHPVQKRILDLLHPLELHSSRQREFAFAPRPGEMVTMNAAQLAAAVADGWLVSPTGVQTANGWVRVMRRGDVESFVVVME